MNGNRYPNSGCTYHQVARDFVHALVSPLTVALGNVSLLRSQGTISAHDVDTTLRSLEQMRRAVEDFRRWLRDNGHGANGESASQGRRGEFSGLGRGELADKPRGNSNRGTTTCQAGSSHRPLRP